jgi:starvation-inducible DNA-binding protein
MAQAKLNEEFGQEVAGELRPLLADLIVLSLQAKQAHWNVTGPLFMPVHEQLDKIVDDLRTWSDEVAERVVTAGVPAAGQVADLARESKLDPLPDGSLTDARVIALMVERVGRVAARGRNAANRLGEIDIISQDIVIEIVKGLEKHQWMLREQLRD